MSACVAHSIRVGAMAMSTDGIGVETVIEGVRDQRVVAVNVHSARSRAAPGEVHRLSPLDFVATRTQPDARCRSRR